uniref:Uncharacterized protein n=1 Tax=Arundo donax TaxID=35708 RepID=A0A0A9HAZ7_ARUDO
MARYAALISTGVAARPTLSASYRLPAAASAGGVARGTAPAMAFASFLPCAVLGKVEW